jgi:hypothetical protein
VINQARHCRGPLGRGGGVTATLLLAVVVLAHVSRAMVKLAARDRAQLVVFAVREGLAFPDAAH